MTEMVRLQVNVGPTRPPGEAQSEGERWYTLNTRTSSETSRRDLLLMQTAWQSNYWQFRGAQFRIESE